MVGGGSGYKRDGDAVSLLKVKLIDDGSSGFGDCNIG